MIDRYTRAEMGKVWTLKRRFEQMLEVERAVALVEAEHGLIPVESAKAIRDGTSIDVERINEIEKTTKHDVIAFVSACAEQIGEHGRYIHFGLTSSDVIDTAFSLLVREAADILAKSVSRLEAALIQQIKRHAETLCAGRTHGMHAEMTTFGLKLSGHLAELRRNRVRIQRALDQFLIGKLSGAVGTYSFLSMEIEQDVCRKLKLQPETIATQVIPRDRHAEVIQSLAFLGCGLERLAIELRHLQRTEVGEAVEGFAPGQKGSSAMPHKKNPISSENITGVARLLRASAHAALEDIALWHERDISHSSVERVIFPDSFILADYACDRMAQVMENLAVDTARMASNMDLSQGQLFSSHVLLALIEKGLSREDAYKLVQSVAHDLKPAEHMSEKLKLHPQVRSYLQPAEIQAIFSGERHKKAIRELISRALDVK